jgi:hypothetical protein
LFSFAQTIDSSGLGCYKQKIDRPQLKGGMKCMKRLWFKSVIIVAALALSATFGLTAEPTTKAAKTPAKAEAAKPAKAATKSNAPKQELVDINTASAAELKAVPGLTDAYVSQLIAKRPYANKSQLVSRQVLPEPVYEKVKERIIAKQPAQKDEKKVSTKPEAKKK